MKDKILLFIQRLAFRGASPLYSLKVLAQAVLYLWGLGMVAAFCSAGLSSIMPEFSQIILMSPALLLMFLLLIVIFLAPFFVLLNLKNAKNRKEKLLSILGLIVWIVFAMLLTLLFSLGITA